MGTTLLSVSSPVRGVICGVPPENQSFGVPGEVWLHGHSLVSCPSPQDLMDPVRWYVPCYYEANTGSLVRTHHDDGLAVFTARCYASAVLAMGLCLSVCHKSEFY